MFGVFGTLGQWVSAFARPSRSRRMTLTATSSLGSQLCGFDLPRECMSSFNLHVDVLLKVDIRIFYKPPPSIHGV